MQQLHDTDKAEYDAIDLGPCCACGQESPEVRNLIALHRPAPVPGTGWGCVVCGLPMNGALVAVCDACLESKALYQHAIYGSVREKGRILFSELDDGIFEHNYNAHRKDNLRVYGVNDQPSRRRNGHNQRSKRTRKSQ